MAGEVSRRRMLAAGMLGALPVAAGAATLRGETPWTGGAAAPVAPQAEPRYIFFTGAEAAFVEAAVARILPADELGPGAVEAGVPFFLDRQLAGQYGQGQRWYMQGPWAKGTPTQGWQTRLTPAETYRVAIRAIDQATGKAHDGKAFHELAPGDQDAFLARLEKGEATLADADGKAFFALLLQNTLEGFWSDPLYGGNRDMVGWKLIGFPGAHYDYTPYVLQHGKRTPFGPVGLKGRPEWTRG